MGTLVREPELWTQPLSLLGGRKQGRGPTVSQCCPLTLERLCGQGLSPSSASRPAHLLGQGASQIGLRQQPWKA